MVCFEAVRRDLKTVSRLPRVTRNVKPVGRAAMAAWKRSVKLLSWKQEPNTVYGLSINGSVSDNGNKSPVAFGAGKNGEGSDNTGEKSKTGYT